jgi:acetyl-CoA carboxylase carboxyl transferase subunit beta
VAVLERVRVARVPYISVMSDPTTGGVFASYAVLGDVNLAEPNALIGFAGARVAAGTIAQELPAGFQRSEFLFEHGFIDRIVQRRALRDEIAALLRFMRAPDVVVESRGTFAPLGALIGAVVGTGSSGGSSGMGGNGGNGGNGGAGERNG